MTAARFVAVLLIVVGVLVVIPIVAAVLGLSFHLFRLAAGLG